jgi:hypothetical protein
MYGAALRSRVDLIPAAFVGTLCRVAPQLLDWRDEEGLLHAGFLPGLAPVFGGGSFDAGAEESRFAGLLLSASPLGTALSLQWAWMQQEVGEDPGGVLEASVASAGVGVPKVQRALTLQREARRFQSLDVQIRDLAVGDMRRCAWLNLDCFSTAWVTCWPAPDAYLSNAEFAEVAARYFGLPSPACAPVVGACIGGTRATLDPYGARLAAATLPGDGWRTQHDCLKWRLVEDAREMGVAVRPEVYGLFAACIPQARRRSLDELPLRKRQGLVPDLLVRARWGAQGPERDILLELKTLHYGSSTYPERAVRRCSAVAGRAAGLPGEYAAKARRVDSSFCGTQPGDVGPVEAKLRSMEAVRGLVFGAWGEASPDVTALLHVLADAGVLRHQRRMLARDAVEARAALLWLMRRRWGLTAVRENARLLLARLEHVGRGAVAAAQRRVVAEDTAARARRAACAGVRGPRASAPRRGFWCAA